MEDPISHLPIYFILTDDFLICDLEFRALVKPDFFTGIVFPFAHLGDYAELEGFVGLGHIFQGKIRDLGHSYGRDRCNKVTPVEGKCMT